MLRSDNSIPPPPSHTHKKKKKKQLGLKLLRGVSNLQTVEVLCPGCLCSVLSPSFVSQLYGEPQRVHGVGAPPPPRKYEHLAVVRFKPMLFLPANAI